MFMRKGDKQSTRKPLEESFRNLKSADSPLDLRRSSGSPPITCEGGDMIETECKNRSYLHCAVRSCWVHLASYTRSLAESLLVRCCVIAGFVGVLTPYVLLDYGAVGFIILFGSLVAIDLFEIWLYERPYVRWLDKVLKRVY